MKDVTENTIEINSSCAEQPSRHENHIGKLNLCSDLASVSSIMGYDGNLRNTDILESIVNNVPTHSNIHHSVDTLYFHNLNTSDMLEYDTPRMQAYECLWDTRTTSLQRKENPVL